MKKARKKKKRTGNAIKDFILPANAEISKEWTDIRYISRYIESDLYDFLIKNNRSAGRRFRKASRIIETKLKKIKKLSIDLDREIRNK